MRRAGATPPRIALALALLLLAGCQTAYAPPGAGTTAIGDNTTVTVGGSVAAEAGVVR